MHFVIGAKIEDGLFRQIMNEEFRYNGQNIHASYSLVDRELK